MVKQYQLSHVLRKSQDSLLPPQVHMWPPGMVVPGRLAPMLGFASLPWNIPCVPGCQPCYPQWKIIQWLFEAGQRKDRIWTIVELVSSSEPSPFMALKPEGYTLMGYVPFMWAKKCPKALWGLYRIIGFLTTVLYLTTDKIKSQGSNNVVFQ